MDRLAVTINMQVNTGKENYTPKFYFVYDYYYWW